MWIKAHRTQILIVALAFLVGTLCGWIVLGWWIAPVEWIDAAPVDLQQAYRDFHLNMLAIAQSSGVISIEDLARLEIGERWTIDEVVAEVNRLATTSGNSERYQALLEALNRLRAGSNNTPSFPIMTATSQVAETTEAPVAQITPTEETPAPLDTPSEQLTAFPATSIGDGPNGCVLRSTYIADVTIPAGTVLEANAPFLKIWRVRNDGTCLWDAGYQLVYAEGTQMSGPAALILPTSAPGQTVDITVNLMAPSAPGNYTGRWRLQASNGAIFGEYTVAIQVVAMSTATPSPSDTPTPTKDPALASLKEEVFFSGGGGAEAPCNAPPSGVPAIEGGGSIGYGHICLWGFPFDETITLNLHAPNGDVYSAVFRIEGQGEDAILVRDLPPMVDNSLSPGFADYDVDGVTDIGILLWWPVSSPTGGWYAVASSASAHAEGPLEVEAVDYSTIDIMPSTGANPFESERSLLFFCGGNSYSAGEQIEIMGTNFPPNKGLPLGIYYKELQDPNGAVLVYSQMVTTDSQGNFRALIHVESSDPSGFYNVIVVTEPTREEYEAGKYGCFRVP